MNFKLLWLFILLIILGVVIFSVRDAAENSEKPLIIVIVENRIANDLQKSLETYREDLKKENYKVIFNTNFDSSTSPSKIRELLAEEYSKNENLEGAVLIGNIPAILFNKVDDQGSLYWHDYLADFYYMDLNGNWSDEDSNKVFDNHTESDNEFLNKIKRFLSFKSNIYPEIWISRLRADKLTSAGNEIDLIKNYFVKNHSYRSGIMELPEKRAFIISAGLSVRKSAWGARPNKIYSNVDVVNRQLNLADSLRKFLGSDDGYELGIINVFSGPRIHHFDYFRTGLDTTWWKLEHGEELIVKYSDSINNSNSFSWKDVKKINPNVLFYHLLCSEAGRHDYQDYLAGSFIFLGKGLVAIAGTQHSGAVGVPILYESLKIGKTFGDSWKDALSSIIDKSGEKIIVVLDDNEQTWIQGNSLYKAVLIGDGTLKLPDFYYSANNN